MGVLGFIIVIFGYFFCSGRGRGIFEITVAYFCT